MKRIIYVIVCALLVSCSTEKKQEVKTEDVVYNDTPDTTVNLHPELDTKTEEETVTKIETVSTNELDEAIDEYAKYMDDYIKYMKKAKAGDQTAMLDAVELMAKAEGVHKRLEEAKGELTSKQLAKFMKIQTKMLEAAQ